MNNLPLSAKLALLPVVLVVALGATTFALVSGINMQREDGVLIDAAGRQRMLNQRYVKEILFALGSSGDTRQAAVAASEKTRALFNSSLSALKDGGMLKIDPVAGISQEVHGAGSEGRKSVLAENSRRFTALAAEATSMLADSTEGGDFDASRVLSLAADVHVMANNATKLFVGQSNKKIDDLIRTCFWISGFAALLSLIISAIMVRSIADPVKNAASMP